MIANSVNPFLRCLVIVLLLVCCAGMTGCMHRRMTVETNPPGARVLVDGRDQGLTPASLDFTYYGTRQITLIKDGYETRTIMQPVQIPWYQIPPLDVISDNFLPFKVTNRHHFQYEMLRKRQVPQRDLIDNANSLRRDLQGGQ